MTRPDPPPVPEGWTAASVTRDGVDLAYYRRPGDGPPLVAVHGITDFGPRLVDLLEALGDYDLVVPDVRGHGRSDAPATGYDLSTAAADLRAVVEDAALEGPPVLLGHSLGGGIATTYAATHPARAVVAIDPVGFLVTPDDDGAGDDAADAEAANGDDWVTDSVIAAREALESGASDVHPAAYASTRVSQFLGRATRDPSERYGAVTAPTLVLRADVGAAERGTDVDLVARLADGRLQYVEGAGHVVYRDRPERTVGLVRDFLGDVDAAPKG